MLFKDLQAEAQRLARPWLRLSAQPSAFPPTALWGGPSPVNHPPPQSGAKHLLSLELDRVRAESVELPTSGVLTMWQPGPREISIQIHTAPIQWDTAVPALPLQDLSRVWDLGVSTLPVCARGWTFAALGGWPWAIDGERVPCDAALVLTVFASTEPQIEGWHRGASFDVITRVT